MSGKPKAWLLATMMLATALTGCIGDANPLSSQSADGEGQALVEDVLELREEQGFVQEVPLTVVLVGFEQGTGDQLEERLSQEEVQHAAYSFTRGFPPDPGGEGGGFDSMLVPQTSRAVYDVQQVDPAAADAFFTDVADETVEDGEAYDANAAEQRLAELLEQQGIPLDSDLPTLVLLHDQDRLGGDHAWRYTYANGHLQPVRAFGETEPLLAYDVSAQPDPYVVGDEDEPDTPFTGSNDVPAYNYPMEAGGNETVELLKELVVDATHYRLLKGAIYPVSTKPCHDVSLVLAVHQSALTQYSPEHQDPEDWVDVPALEAAFANATGDEVSVSLDTLALPVDDPALDALTRRAAGAAESQVFLDAMRWYLDRNWETYADPDPACEDYLSLLLFADVTSEPGRAFSGVGMYDVDTDRRITFSVVTDAYRAASTYEGPGDDAVGGYDAPDREPDYVNRLFSHETGHILGLHHPQHLNRADQASPVNHAFESVLSSMSYQVSDRTIDFGQIDKHQFQRNRAGYIVQQAQRLGLQDTASFDEALEAAANHDWVGVQQALEDEVQQAAEDTDDELVPHVGGHHWHPR